MSGVKGLKQGDGQVLKLSDGSMGLILLLSLILYMIIKIGRAHV